MPTPSSAVPRSGSASRRPTTCCRRQGSDSRSSADLHEASRANARAIWRAALGAGNVGPLVDRALQRLSVDPTHPSWRHVFAFGCGATINERNAGRKHRSLFKAGQFARAAAPARLIALILSDVIGDPLDVIASGPTAPDPTTFADALTVLQQRGVAYLAPTAVRA